MSDVNGAAPAAAEQPSLPMDAPEHVSPPAPIESKGPTPEAKPEPVKDKPSPTISDALRKANEKVKADAAKEAPAKIEAKPDAKPDAKAEPKSDAKSDGPVRGEDGKFAPKDPAKVEAKVEAKAETPKDAPFREAPKRFSEDAKAAWEKAPDPVKAEAHRAIKELESGINEYRQKYEPLKQYDDLARQANTSIKDALDRYTGLERSLASENPQEKFAAIQKVFDYAGVNMREFAAQLAGVSPDQASVHSEQQLQQLRMRNSELENELSGYRSEREQKVMSTVDEFAAQNPRFEELSAKVAKLLESGLAENLQEAYEMADRLKPAPAKASAVSPVIPEQPEAHTLKGQKSVAGSPSVGSSPVKGKSSPSIKEALQRALAKAS